MCYVKQQTNKSIPYQLYSERNVLYDMVNFKANIPSYIQLATRPFSVDIHTINVNGISSNMDIYSRLSSYEEWSRII